MDIARDALWVMDYLAFRPDVLQDQPMVMILQAIQCPEHLVW